jgi:hypothetical protein
MRQAVLMLLSVLSVGSICSAQTTIDIQPAKQLTRGNSIGSCSYTPIEKEMPLFDKLDSDERVTGSAFTKPYRIQGKKGHFVSWFGIVRGISHPQPDGNQLSLLLEQKYFDGLTDCHIMLVSSTGSGDFQHEVKIMGFTKWLDRNGGSPRETADRIRIRSIRGMEKSNTSG